MRDSLREHSNAGAIMRGAALSAVAALCCLAVSGQAVHAQGFGGDFGGFATNPDAPINIESDSLDVDDAKKIAIFRGNVVAKQDGFEMRSKELQVTYGGNPTAAVNNNAVNPAENGGGSTELKELKAVGDVFIQSDQDQRATADWALFKVKDQMITVGGNVVLSQGKNVMRGQKLIIDLKNGRSRFENAAQGGKPGRIRGVFHPNRKPKAGAASKPRSSGWGNQSVSRSQ